MKSFLVSIKPTFNCNYCHQDFQAKETAKQGTLIFDSYGNSIFQPSAYF